MDKLNLLLLLVDCSSNVSADLVKVIISYCNGYAMQSRSNMLCVLAMNSSGTSPIYRSYAGDSCNMSLTLASELAKYTTIQNGTSVAGSPLAQALSCAICGMLRFTKVYFDLSSY